MTDRELIELTARACEIPIERLEDQYAEYQDLRRISGFAWNPLENSKDSFELMCRLKICIDFDDVDVKPEDPHFGDWVDGVIACVTWITKSSIVATIKKELPLGVDCDAATRRAIVLVAAELGNLK